MEKLLLILFILRFVPFTELMLVYIEEKAKKESPF